MGGLLLQNGKQAFTDANSRPLSGGRVFFYSPGTQTPRDTWQDAALTILNTNPVILDARGEASIYGVGAYRQVLRDASNVLIWDQVLPDILGVVNDAISSFFLSNLTVVPSIAALRLLDSTVRKNAFATGYYAPGDLGGGAYFLDALDTSTADNGGSVIVGADGGRWKLTKTDKMNAAQFGARANGTDATTFINKAITALPAGGTLSGSGLTYSVTSCNLKSFMIMEDFNLLTLAGTLDFASPITINGTATAKTNISVLRVFVDGNRSNQTNIVSPGEDGGRHAFRIVGKVSNLLLEDCHGNNSAGDGFEIYSSTSVGPTDDIFVFSTIKMLRCTGNGNRRHGLSIDSVRDLLISDSVFNGNGLDLNTVDPMTVGTRGARVGNNLSNPVYGNGLDIEGYGVGSAVNQVHLTNVEARANAKSGCLFYDAVSQATSGFGPRQKFFIHQCYFDAGIGPASDGASLQFTSTIFSKTGVPIYTGIIVSDSRLEGYVLLRCVDDATFVNCSMYYNGLFIANFDHATNVSFSIRNNGTATAINSDTSTYTFGQETQKFPGNPVITFSSGAAGTLSNIVYGELENNRNRFYTYSISADWVPSASGVSVFSITPPGIATVPQSAHVAVLDSNTGFTVPAGHYPDIGGLRLVATTVGAVHKIRMVVTLKV